MKPVAAFWVAATCLPGCPTGNFHCSPLYLPLPLLVKQPPKIDAIDDAYDASGKRRHTHREIAEGATVHSQRAVGSQEGEWHVEAVRAEATIWNIFS